MIADVQVLWENIQYIYIVIKFYILQLQILMIQSIMPNDVAQSGTENSFTSITITDQVSSF